MNREQKVKKMYKFFLTTILVMLFIIITFNKFIEEDFGKNIEKIIGTEYTGGAVVSVRDNFVLKSAMNIYIQTINSGDFDGAYNYLLPQYKEFISKEVYIQKMNEVGIENFVIQNLELRHETENMFSFDVTIKNDIKLKTLLILTDDNYYIIPEPFLKYEEVNKKISKNGVTYELHGYQVDLDRCIFDMTITNDSNNEVEIYQVKMINTAGGTQNAINSKTKIQPKEVLQLSYKVETHIDFPMLLELTRRDGEKIRVYTFEL